MAPAEIVEDDDEDDDVVDGERRYPARALTDALAACLDRLLALLRRMAPEDAAWQAGVDPIEAG